MDNKTLRNLIEKIENVVGPCEYDEDGIDEVSDTFILWIDKYTGVGIEIDIESLKISPFISFAYYDFSKTELENGHYDIEEIEQEEKTKLLESSFTLYLKSHSPNYTATVWDDGGYMCPGYVARVGFHLENYTEEIIKEFFAFHREYSSTIECLSDSELRKFIFKSICHDHNVKVEMSSGIVVGNASLKISDRKSIPDNNVEYYYLGKEKFLFSVSGEHYAADVCPINMFIEAHDMCEMFDDITFSFNDLPLFDSSFLRVIGAHMELTIPANKDIDRIYSQIEESAAILNSSSIVPFASEKFREVYYRSYSNLFDSYLGKEPIIITEGSTDWKHLKKYWEQYCQESLKIRFWEYEPANSNLEAEIKQDMGSSALLEMCKAYSKMKLGKVFIFIADRDESKIVKEMGDDIKKYKDWGNKVYSLVLPLPQHRKETREICIEHYYSDEEIKTLYTCADGRERRLFLGNDFDEYGRGIDSELLCIKRSLCGQGSIKVIDGSSDARVISMKEKNDVNYALSKQDFAAHSTIQEGSPTYDAFSEIFSIIQDIIRDSE